MILDIDATGVAVKFQSQTFRAARLCVRKQVGAAELRGEEVDPLKERLRAGGLDLGNQREPVDGEGSMDVSGVPN